MITIIVWGLPQTAMAVQFCLEGDSQFRIKGFASNSAEAARLAVSAPAEAVMIVDDAVDPQALGKVNLPAAIWNRGHMNTREKIMFLSQGGIIFIPADADKEVFLAHLRRFSDAKQARKTTLDEFVSRDRKKFTRREEEVLTLVKKGCRNKEIAAALGIAVGTVKIHLKHMFEKTGVKNRYLLALQSLRASEIPVNSH